MNRAKGNSGELVAWNESGVHEEVLRRNAKAGYCTRDGEPTGATKIMAKPANAQYRKNYRKIFGHD